MKNILTFLLIILSPGLFIQCKKKDNNSYKFATYTTTDSTELFLFVNDQSKGKLPLLPDDSDDCNDNKALRFSLPEGTYNFTAKDQQGSLKVAVIVKLESDEITMTYNVGNYSMFAIDRCVNLGLSY